MIEGDSDSAQYPKRAKARHRGRVYRSVEEDLAKLGEQVGDLPPLSGHGSRLTREAGKRRRQNIARARMAEKRRLRGQRSGLPIDEPAEVITPPSDSVGGAEAVDRFMRRLAETDKIIRKNKGEI